MKFQSLLLCTSLIVGTVFAEKKDYAYTTDDFKYNFYCLEDNKGICKFLEDELYQSVNSISKIVDIEQPVNFEAFVDDLSKYRVNTNKETLAILLDNEFKPINVKDTTKDNNIIAPYPNSEALLKKINNEEKKNDFILVLNNFNSDKKYLDTIQDDFDSSITMEIFDGLKVLNKVGYPYVAITTTTTQTTTNFKEYEMEGYLPKRENMDLIYAEAEEMVESCQDIINLDKVHTIIHWEDQLIAKIERIDETVDETNDKTTEETTDGIFEPENNKTIENPKKGKRKNRCYVVVNKNKKNRNTKNPKIPVDVNKKIPKPENKNEYDRVVVLGDIHGDFEHLIKILRHAKLIDEENQWIGTDSILMQVGDLMDRGDDTLKVYDFMVDLREQAQKKGGIVYLIIGNHEIMALQGQHHFTTARDNDSFGGFDKREEAFGPNGKFGKLLREELNVTMVIDDTLFSHAGVTSNFVEEGVDKINEKAHEILKSTPSVEDLYQLYLKENFKHPIYTEPLLGEEGPIFYRNFANKPEAEICPELEKTLQATNTKRLVVGHNPQSYGKIRTKCDGKLILIDIGISRCISGGYYGYLEILNNKNEIWARYLDSN